jgi:hypothetical protein
MPSQSSRRPREITVAAVVAFAGSGLFILVDLLLARFAGVMLYTFTKNYPGVSLDSKDPDFLQFENFFIVGIACFLVLGVIGIITGRGMLRLRSWARQSAILWSIGSSLLCLAALAYSGSKSGLHLSASGILLLMLFLFPVNAWWLMLFFRADIKSLFTPARTLTRSSQLPLWLQENFISKIIIVIAAALILILGARWWMRRNSPMREIERSRDAMVAVKSWHFHTVRYIPGQPVETVDMDFVCPSYQRSTNSWEDASGKAHTRDSIRYFTSYYNYVGGHWITAQQSSGELPDILECNVGPLNANENSLNFTSVIADGTAKRGELKDVNGDSCREYDVTFPTPHDPAERQFQFTVCINEQDHLPRESRHSMPGAAHEGVSTFGKWNAMPEPELPAEIAK